MKRVIIVIIASSLFTARCFSQFSLHIEISGIRNNNGTIMFQLLDQNEKILNQKIGKIVNCISVFTIGDLKPGKYAIRYYHDENLNGLMEKNALGKPIEGYGFSNNVTGKFGPPPFEKWLFEIDSDKKIFLKPVY